MINHLANRTEQLANAGHVINNSRLKNRLEELQRATDDVKLAMIDCLPNEIFHNFWVINYTEKTLTIAVNSITARNHIYYVRKTFIEILNNNSTLFNHLTDIQVKVVHLPEA